MSLRARAKSLTDPYRASWLAVVFAALLIAFGSVMASHLATEVGRLGGVRFAHATLALVVLAFSVAMRKRWSRRLGAWLLVLLIAPYYPISWGLHAASARGTALWIPLFGYKLLFLALSVLIPGAYWVNALLILGFAIEAAVLWFVLDLAHVPSAVTAGEPWSSILFAVVAASLLAFRASRDRAMRDLERARAQVESMEQVARVFLSLRDKCNTPLQTLDVSAALLRAKHPDALHIADAVTNASTQLAKMSVLLSRYEAHDAWPEGELMSDEEIALWLDRVEPAPRARGTEAPSPPQRTGRRRRIREGAREGEPPQPETVRPPAGEAPEVERTNSDPEVPTPAPPEPCEPSELPEDVAEHRAASVRR